MLKVHPTICPSAECTLSEHTISLNIYTECTLPEHTISLNSYTEFTLPELTISLNSYTECTLPEHTISLNSYTECTLPEHTISLNSYTECTLPELTMSFSNCIECNLPEHTTSFSSYRQSTRQPFGKTLQLLVVLSVCCVVTITNDVISHLHFCSHKPQHNKDSTYVDNNTPLIMVIVQTTFQNRRILR